MQNAIWMHGRRACLEGCGSAVVHTGHRSVWMGVCTWFLIHTVTLPSTAVFQHRVFKWSIINEPVCSWFIPNANKILSILRRDVKVKAVSSPSLSSLSAAGVMAYLLLHAGTESIFSAGCPGHRRPVETPHSRRLHNKQKITHPVERSRLTGFDRKGRQRWSDRQPSVTIHPKHILQCLWPKYQDSIKASIPTKTMLVISPLHACCF